MHARPGPGRGSIHPLAFLDRTTYDPSGHDIPMLTSATTPPSRLRLRLALACLGCLLLAACSPSSSPSKPAAGPAAPPASQGPVTNYTVRGVVRQLPEGGKSVVIKHDEIPGYMVAMTMPFPVRDPALLNSIRIGDKVEFELSVTADDGWISGIRPLPDPSSNTRPIGVATSSAPEQVNILPNVKELEPGELLPDFALTNQLGQVIQTSAYRGQALVFTFIFTRCPFPTFCLRMSQNFKATQDRLKKESNLPNWHLLTISFDPDFDTPERLAQYGAVHGQDPSRWTLATGAWDQLYPLTGHFGLYFARNVPPQEQNHKLRTVVIDATGKVHKVLLGNEWTPDDLAAAVREAAGKR